MTSEARQWRHYSDKTQTNKLEWWIILKISLRAKAGVPKTLLKRKHCLHFLYFQQHTLMLIESHGEFSDLHSNFRLCALHYSVTCLIIDLDVITLTILFLCKNHGYDLLTCKKSSGDIFCKKIDILVFCTALSF